jgi:hypothetical protein
MPNWCNNTLTIQDCDEPFDTVMKDYLTTIKDEDTGNTETILDFQKIVPMPVELKGTVSPTPSDIDPELQKTLLEKYGADNWYDWCARNWGTKWNCCDPFISESGMSFTTAWSPPLPVITDLAKLIGKDLRLTYIEEGMGFCGEFYAYGNGTIIENEYETHEAPQALLEELGYEEWEEA